MAGVKRVRLDVADPVDAVAVATLRNAVADALTGEFGEGHWSSYATERGVLSGMKQSRVYVVRRRGKIVATLTLQTKKPWAIDTAYFTPCKKPLYLINMAVEPKLQRTGVGRACLDATTRVVREWRGDAIRLDAYDAGAGEFYRKCGFREMGRVVYRNTGLVYYELML